MADSLIRIHNIVEVDVLASLVVCVCVTGVAG
jgi:hypothetical protein